MLKTILFTHDDLDGAGCRIIFEIAHKHLEKGFHFDVIICSNNNVDEKVSMNLSQRDDIDANTLVYFADIVPGREVLEDINKKFEIKIFDHHRTNFFAEHIVSESVIIPENNLGQEQSGTSLLYQHFCEIAYESKDPRGFFFKGNGNTNLMAEFVDNVRSYDTFEFKQTGKIEPKKLQILFLLLGMERFCKRYIDMLVDPDSGYNLITKGDMDFVDAKIELEKNIIDHVTPNDVYSFNVGKYKCAFTYGFPGANISELGYAFLQKYPEYDIMCSFSLLGGGSFQFRSVKDDIDVGKNIAVLIGGGGHPKASGAPLSEGLKDQILETLIDYLNSPFK